MNINRSYFFGAIVSLVFLALCTARGHMEVITKSSTKKVLHALITHKKNILWILKTEYAKIFLRYWTHFLIRFHFESCLFRFCKESARIKPIPEFWSLIILKMWSFVRVFYVFKHIETQKERRYLMILHRIW